MNLRQGNALGLAAIMMWSTSALLIWLTGNLPPLQTAAIVTSVCTCIYVLKWVVFRTNPRHVLKGLRVSDILTACLGVGLYMCFYYVALKSAPILEANFLNYLWPLLLVLFSSLMHGPRLRVFQLVGLLGGLAGAYFIIVVGKNAGTIDLAPEHYLGYGLAVAGAVIWAGYSALTRKKPFPSDAMVFVYAFTGLLCWVCHFIFEQTISPTGFQIGLLCLMGVLSLSYSLWDLSMKYGEIDLIASLSYFIPLFSTLLLLAFAERPDGQSTIIGGLLIIGGCLLANGHRIFGFLRPKRA